jgi:LytS/YehU family sensor histidine kinase
VLLTLIETTTLHFDAVRAGRASAPAVLLLDRAVSDVVWPIIAAIVFAWIDRATRRAAPGGIAAGSFALRAARLGLALAPLYVPWGCAARTVVHGGDLAYFANEMRRIASTTYLWDAFLFAMIALTACVVVVSQRSRHHERDSAELKARLAHAELDLLRAQLEPHFLFNALNTIAGLIRTAHPELATDALAKLSELLRYVVEASRQDRVPLAWELEFATNYLELQQLRFGPRMQFAIHLDAGRACDVPPLLLQPLIENAVVHGVAPTSDPVTIVVHILEANGELRVEIGNTRDDHASTGRASTGVGLRNTRQRLERMYGEDFVLDAGPDGPDHYRVTIALPQAAGYA